MSIKGSYRSLLTLLISAAVALFTLTGSVYAPAQPVQRTTVEQIDGSPDQPGTYLRVNFREKYEIDNSELQWLLAELFFSLHCDQLDYSLKDTDLQPHLLSILANFSVNRKEPPLQS